MAQCGKWSVVQKMVSWTVAVPTKIQLRRSIPLFPTTATRPMSWRAYVATTFLCCGIRPIGVGAFHAYHPHMRTSAGLAASNRNGFLFLRPSFGLSKHCMTRMRTITLNSSTRDATSATEETSGMDMQEAGEETTPKSDPSLPTTDPSSAVFASIYPKHQGDWAGHVAEFHPTDGSVIPVPEYLVPESMIEWGQVPNCLEVLTSERCISDASSVDEEENGGDSVVLEKATVTIFPEVGCGVDNLEATVTKEQIEFQLVRPSGEVLLDDEDEQSSHGTAFPDDTMVVVRPKKAASKQRKRLHFDIHFLDQSPSSGEGKEDIVGEDLVGDINGILRTRVLLDVVLNDDSGGQWEIVKPLQVIRERKTSNTSTNGDVAAGGGLDGRTVANLIGIDNVNKPFVDADPAEDESDGTTLHLAGGVSLISAMHDEANHFDLVVRLGEKQVHLWLDSEGSTCKLKLLQ